MCMTYYTVDDLRPGRPGWDVRQFSALAEAGISPNAALESFVEKGRVIVQAAEKTAADVLIDELDDDVRTMLEDSGVQLEGVCRLLEKEEILG